FALLARADGALLAVTTPRWPDFDLSKSAWWPSAPLRDQVLITEPQSVPGMSGDLILILVPVGGSTPSAQASILVAGLNANQSIDPVLTEQLPQQETAWLARQDGKVLAGTAPGGGPLPQAWLDTFTAPDGGSSESPQGRAGEAADTVLAYAPLSRNLGYAQNDL